LFRVTSGGSFFLSNADKIRDSEGEEREKGGGVLLNHLETNSDIPLPSSARPSPLNAVPRWIYRIVLVVPD